MLMEDCSSALMSVSALAGNLELGHLDASVDIGPVGFRFRAQGGVQPAGGSASSLPRSVDRVSSLRDEGRRGLP